MAYIVEEIAPLAEPLLLADVKNMLKVPSGVTADDTYINDLIQCAREEVESYTGRSIVNKGYRQTLDSFPYYVDTVMSQQAYPPSYYSLPRYSTTLWNYSQMIKLLRGPLVAISRIAYSNSQTGTEQNLYPTFPNWQALTVVPLGWQIEDPNGNLQVVTAVAESDEDKTSMTGATEPTFASNVGGTTPGDGAITWTCKGPVPDSGDFVYDADNIPPRIFPNPGQYWPSVLYTPNAVRVHFTAGYGNDGNAAPARLRQVMRYLITDAYFNRDPTDAVKINEHPRLARMLWSLKMPVQSPTRG